MILKPKLNGFLVICNWFASKTKLRVILKSKGLKYKMLQAREKYLKLEAITKITEEPLNLQS